MYGHQISFISFRTVNMRPFRWHHSGFQFHWISPLADSVYKTQCRWKMLCHCMQSFTMAFFRWSFSLEMVDSNALGPPPAPSPVVACVHLFSPVFTSFHLFSPIFTRFHQFSPVFTHYQPFSPVFFRPHPCSPTLWCSPVFTLFKTCFIHFHHIFTHFYQIVPNFTHFYWYWWYFLHTLRDLVSHVWGFFVVVGVFWQTKLYKEVVTVFVITSVNFNYKH